MSLALLSALMLNIIHAENREVFERAVRFGTQWREQMSAAQAKDFDETTQQHRQVWERAGM